MDLEQNAVNVAIQAKGMGNILLQSALGIAGAGVRVAIGHDRGEPQSVGKIVATFVTGSILAGTSNQAMTAYLNLPDAFAGAVSFFVGVLGLGFVYKLLDGKIFPGVVSQASEKDSTRADHT